MKYVILLLFNIKLKGCFHIIKAILDVPLVQADFNVSIIGSDDWNYKHKTVSVDILEEDVYVFSYEFGLPEDYCISAIKDANTGTFSFEGKGLEEHQEEVTRNIYWLKKAMVEEKYKQLITYL